MSHLVYAPFNEEQIKSLNGFQVAGVFHEFTCSNCRDTLKAKADGWFCPHCHNHVKQDWAHSFMTDGSWRNFENLNG